jgi:acetyl-CoA carboxylase biotin carboxylase subunit
VANRGEIAVRIIRTLKEKNIKSVAIYSTADRNSLHVALADEAYCIGPGPSSQSYLDMDKILMVARLSQADAIHPGYGFLAENAEFVKKCEDEGLKFIGPSTNIISIMGNKAAARSTVEKHGLPVIPGSDGFINDLQEGKKIASEIGYPIVVKAVSGGGGKGMRLITEEKHFNRLFKEARKEALNSFNDGRLYIEKYITSARHIEVQVLGDGKGNVVHLYERDCSIQHNNQKMIEEAPASILDEETRQNLTDITAKVMSELKYESAGTVEYLYVESENKFYFMEMNTRIQVEHPVSEVITGVDIIEQQLEVAFNERLTIEQSDIQRNGFAIEVRINAHDPNNDFVPSPGTIEYLHFGKGKNVRIDSHIYTGYTISPHYDSMLAKIITHGDTREEAITYMKRVLAETVIGPNKNNLSFQSFLMNHPEYQANNLDIHFLKNNDLI